MLVCIAPCDRFPHLHAGRDAAEDRVFAVEMLGGCEGDEELRAVRVRARVRHRENTRARVLQTLVDLVAEMIAVDRSTAAT